MTVRFYEEVEDSLLKFAVIIARTEGKYVFCKHKSRETLEVPGGHREEGETILAAAKRELQEETGYVSDDWKHVITVPSSATISDNYAYVFAAGNCRKSAEQKLDETEFLNVRKYSAAELEKMIHNGEFQQAVHIMAWLLSQK